MNNWSRKISGFSLVEVMVVIAIIGIITAFALPSYKKYILKAKYMEGVTLLQDCMKKMQIDYSMNNVFPNKVCGINQGSSLAINSNSVEAMTYQVVGGTLGYLQLTFNASVIPSGNRDLHIAGRYSATANNFVTLCGQWSGAYFTGGDVSLLPASCNNTSVSTNILAM